MKFILVLLALMAVLALICHEAMGASRSRSSSSRLSNSRSSNSRSLSLGTSRSRVSGSVSSSFGRRPTSGSTGINIGSGSSRPIGSSGFGSAGTNIGSATSKSKISQISKVGGVGLSKLPTVSNPLGIGHLNQVNTGTVGQGIKNKQLWVGGINKGVGSRFGRKRCTSRSECFGGFGGYSGHCTAGLCTCAAGYTQTINGCVQSVERHCTFDSDCGDQRMTCSVRRCVCKAGYRPTSFGCESLTDHQRVKIVDGVVRAKDDGMVHPSQNQGAFTAAPSWKQHNLDFDHIRGKPCWENLDCPRVDGFTGWCKARVCECSSHYQGDYACKANGASPTSPVAAVASVLVVMATALI